MKYRLEYRIENGSLIIDSYFNDLKIGSIDGGSVENILNKCKLYDEEYETFLKENEYMKHITKDFEQLQQENKQLKDNWIKLKEYLENEIKLYENDIQNFKKDYKVYSLLINDLRVSKSKMEEVLNEMQEIERSDSNEQMER